MNYFCDGCDKEITDEIRMHCEQCKDFDLCIQCFKKDNFGKDFAHQKSHQMVEKRPAPPPEKPTPVFLPVSTPGSIPPFRVHDVEVGSKLAVISPDRVRGAWGEIGKLLAHSKVDGDLPVVEFFTSPNLLAACVYKAFYRHYPIKINPNSIWLTICQGFAIYVDGNSEDLRSKFVSFEGKKTLTVSRPDFTRNYQNNKWEEVFPSFVSQIAGYVGKQTADMLDCNFSNSTPLDKAAAHIAVMDIMKHYFRYSMMCGCGIPYIELLGKPEDWVLIRQKAEALSAYSTPKDPTLTEWMKELLPVLDQFVDAAQGKVDVRFWGAVCNVFTHHSGSSGMGGWTEKGATISGWMQVFFPYEKKTALHGFASTGKGGVKGKRNYLVSNWREAYDLAQKYGVAKALEFAQAKSSRGDSTFPHCVSGTKLEDIPSGLSRAPVNITWADGLTPKEQKVHFYAGLVSMHQHPDRALEVRPGWAIMEPVKELDVSSDW